MTCFSTCEAIFRGHTTKKRICVSRNSRLNDFSFFRIVSGIIFSLGLVNFQSKINYAKILEKLIEVDYQMKTGKAEAKLLLNLFISKI